MTNIFEVTDPRGLTVICTEEQWINHILAGHNLMAGSEAEVSKVITKPSLGIYTDKKHPTRTIYYGFYSQPRPRYLKVVVEFHDDIGTVITAYQTDGMKQGEYLIWPTSGS